MNTVSVTNIGKKTAARTINDLYRDSMKVYMDLVKSVKSRSLEELYTDEFRPSKTKSNITTVKSLATGKPVEAELSEALISGKSENVKHRLKYFLKTVSEGKFLGSKIFSIDINPDKTKKFMPGFIKSPKNNEYSGTQIRLLQTACEKAKRDGVKQIRALALMPSVIFHTMMGFRPSRSFSMEVKTPEDVQTVFDALISINPARVSMNDYIPILSKKGNKYYLDKNRTIYCAAMRANARELKESGKRNLSLKGKILDEAVDMVLQGHELNKWNERIKGFEITPDGGNTPKKMTFLQKLVDFIKS